MRILFFVLMFSLIFTKAICAQTFTPTPDCDINNDSIIDYQDILLFCQQWYMGEKYTPTPSFTPTLNPTKTPAPSAELIIDVDQYTPGIQTLAIIERPLLGTLYYVDIYIIVHDYNFSDWHSANFNIAITGAETPTTFYASGIVNDNLGTFTPIEEDVSQTQIKLAGEYESKLGNDPVLFYRIRFTIGTSDCASIIFSPKSGEISNSTATLQIEGADSQLYWEYFPILENISITSLKQEPIHKQNCDDNSDSIADLENLLIYEQKQYPEQKYIPTFAPTITPIKIPTNY